MNGQNAPGRSATDVVMDVEDQLFGALQLLDDGHGATLSVVQGEASQNLPNGIVQVLDSRCSISPQTMGARRAQVEGETDVLITVVNGSRDVQLVRRRARELAQIVEGFVHRDPTLGRNVDFVWVASAQVEKTPRDHMPQGRSCEVSLTLGWKATAQGA